MADVKGTIEDYAFIKKLGNGAFGTVSLVLELSSGKEYAAKAMKRAFLSERKMTHVARVEKEALRILRDNWRVDIPFFVKVHCTFLTRENLYIIMTYAVNKTLAELIEKRGKLTVELTRFYAAEMVLALEHLRSLKIIQRDLKPLNILLNERMHILLADFGCCHLEDESDEPNERRSKRKNARVGTVPYMSPEAIDTLPFDHTTTLWSLGVTIYEMLLGHRPFDGLTEEKTIANISNADYEFPNKFHKEGEKLIRSLLVKDPQRRIGATNECEYISIRNINFFFGMPFNTLYQQTAPVKCIYKRPKVFEEFKAITKNKKFYTLNKKIKLHENIMSIST